MCWESACVVFYGGRFEKLWYFLPMRLLWLQQKGCFLLLQAGIKKVKRVCFLAKAILDMANHLVEWHSSKTPNTYAFLDPFFAFGKQMDLHFASCNDFLALTALLFCLLFHTLSSMLNQIVGMKQTFAWWVVQAPVLVEPASLFMLNHAYESTS